MPRPIPSSPPIDSIPFRPPMFSDRVPVFAPIGELHFTRARKQLSKTGKDAAVKAILKDILSLDSEHGAITKSCLQFSRDDARARWFADMADAISKADGREVPKKHEFIEAQLRRMRPLKTRLTEISKEATPPIIKLWELLIAAFIELAADRAEEEKAFAGGEDFTPSNLLQAYSYAAKVFLPCQIKRLLDTPSNRKPSSLLFGITS